MEAAIDKILADIDESPLTEKEKIMMASLSRDTPADTIVEIILQFRGFL